MTWLRTVAVGLTLVLGANVHAADRLALVVGNNHGGGSKPALRYAERDAQQVAQVLRDLGGVGRVRVLLGRSAADLRRAFDEVKSEARDRSVLFFFYSGHADEDALQLGDSRLGFKELRSRLKSVPVPGRATPTLSTTSRWTARATCC
jgi:uncharacterized caspase-like protein